MSRSLGDLLDQPVGELLGPGGRVERGVAEALGDLGDAGDLVPRGPLQRRLEDVGLGREVPGGRGQRDAGLDRDAAVGDGGDAVARDDLHRGGDDRVADPLGGLGARAGDGGHVSPS